MSSTDDRYALPDERVSTEPQRRALDAMSDELVRKLHTMVAEQEARARDFAAHQHSLSSLPQLTPYQPPQQPPHTPAGNITNGPRPALRQQNTPPQHPSVHYGDIHSTPSDFFPEEDSLPEPKKERGIGAGTIVFIVFIILVILRNCG